MTISQPVYVTRESVQRALDVKTTARVSRSLDEAIESASRGVDKLCHRRFYPEAATRSWDWPNAQRARPWRLWLDDSELISVTTLTSGGTTIAASDFNLEPNRTGPPFNQIQIDLSSSASFGGGDTHQQDITVTGLFGYANDESSAGTVAEALDASETAIDVDADGAAALGVGSILRIDSERMIVQDRVQLDTGQNLASDIDAQNKTTTVPVADGTGYAVDEIILIDAERMLIVDIAGNNLIVERAFDGTTIAAHTSGADIFAPRTLTVERGALGTTAATHDDGTAISRWNPPAPVRSLARAEAMNTLLQEQAGYLRLGNPGSSVRPEATLEALKDLRTQVYDNYGRKARVRGV